MTLLLALTLAQAAETPIPSATAEEEREIVVIGRKSAWWRGAWAEKNGVTTCATEISTGDAAIDTIMCDGLLACAPRYLPEMKSIAQARQATGKPTTQEELAKLLKPTTQKFRHCARAGSRQPFLALIRARKATRQ